MRRVTVCQTEYGGPILVTVTRKLGALTVAALVLAAGFTLIVAGLQSHKTVTHVPNRHTHSAVYYPSARPVRTV